MLLHMFSVFSQFCPLTRNDLDVVNPDEFIVFKPTLKQGFSPIVSKKLGSKEQKVVLPFKTNTSLFLLLSKHNLS